MRAMAKPSKKSKSKSSNAADGANKSAFIRTVPASTPAGEVVKLAAEKGIKINAGLVYAVRSADKRKDGAPKRKPGRPAKNAQQPNTRAIKHPSSSDLRHQFVTLAVRIGTDEAQRLLSNLIDVQTQVSRSVK